MKTLITILLFFNSTFISSIAATIDSVKNNIIIDELYEHPKFKKWIVFWKLKIPEVEDFVLEKTYTIEIQDETTLREMVSQTKETVKTDLKALHTVIKTAHEAVRDAIRTLNAARPLVSPEPTS